MINEWIIFVKNIYGGETNVALRDQMRMLLNFTSDTLEAFFADECVGEDNYKSSASRRFK